jgi:hypothetical protein
MGTINILADINVVGETVGLAEGCDEGLEDGSTDGCEVGNKEGCLLG